MQLVAPCLLFFIVALCGVRGEPPIEVLDIPLLKLLPPDAFAEDAVMARMRWNHTAEELKKSTQWVIDHLDINHDGYVNEGEIHYWYRMIRARYGTSKLLSLYDKNLDSTITFYEIDHPLVPLYEYIDVNLDGVVETDELIYALDITSLPWSSFRAHVMMTRYDGNKDGVIDFMEFCIVHFGNDFCYDDANLELRRLRRMYVNWDADKSGRLQYGYELENAERDIAAYRLRKMSSYCMDVMGLPPGNPKDPEYAQYGRRIQLNIARDNYLRWAETSMVTDNGNFLANPWQYIMPLEISGLMPHLDFMPFYNGTMEKFYRYREHRSPVFLNFEVGQPDDGKTQTSSKLRFVWDLKGWDREETYSPPPGQKQLRVSFPPPWALRQEREKEQEYRATMTRMGPPVNLLEYLASQGVQISDATPKSEEVKKTHEMGPKQQQYLETRVLQKDPTRSAFSRQMEANLEAFLSEMIRQLDDRARTRNSDTEQVHADTEAVKPPSGAERPTADNKAAEAVQAQHIEQNAVDVKTKVDSIAEAEPASVGAPVSVESGDSGSQKHVEVAESESRSDNVETEESTNPTRRL